MAVQRRRFQWQELLQRAAQYLGGDPLAVRQVYGAVEHGQKPTSADFAAYVAPAGSFADDEPMPADVLAAPYVQRAQDFAFLKLHSAARFYVEFREAGAAMALDAGGTVTVTPWRLQANGALVQGAPFTNLGHRVEVRDEHVAGRVTLYQITDIAPPANADEVRLYVAAEGLGYLTEEP